MTKTKNKKGVIGWQYIVGLIIALMVLLALIYLIFLSKGRMIDIIGSFKNII